MHPSNIEYLECKTIIEQREWLAILLVVLIEVMEQNQVAFGIVIEQRKGMN